MILFTTTGGKMIVLFAGCIFGMNVASCILSCFFKNILRRLICGLLNLKY